MQTWQNTALARLRDALGGRAVTPYGSVTVDGSLDGWSDLDVEIAAGEPFDLAQVVGGDVWAFQNTVEDHGAQTVRAVFADGRRIDARAQSQRMRLPAHACDNRERFDATLAAVSFGRGRDLIGLHLSLGVLREALVTSMHAADRTAGRTHHRSGSALDARASVAAAVLAPPLRPETAREVYALYGAWRADIEPGYVADASGIEAVIARGQAR